MRDRHRDNVAAAAAVGLPATAAAAAAIGAWLGDALIYAATACAILAAMMTVMAWLGEPHPFPRFGAANYVTLARAAMLSLLAALIGRPASAGVLWFIVATAAAVAVLDGVDGWIARRTGIASNFGARFDMETDAALILVLSILVWQHGKAGSWVLLCGLMRYGFVAAGRLLPWLASPLRSTWRGKTVAAGQYVALTVAIAPIVPVPLATAVAAAALAALTWSFAVDVLWLRRRATCPS